jgi:DnaJ-class molecular chaperone
MAVRVNSTADTPSESRSSSGGGPAAGAAAFTSSILCKDCDGNGAVVCSQCEGEGVNKEDHFGGRFKTGGTCWLCRGKRQMLCGNCNGAGFMGGFMNTQDD